MATAQMFRCMRCYYGSTVIYSCVSSADYLIANVAIMESIVALKLPLLPLAFEQVRM